MVKQPKKALNTFNDKRYYNIKYEIVPWVHCENRDEIDPLYGQENHQYCFERS